MPTWQEGFGTVANLGSTATKRMVPDVSLDADPNTGYSIYYSAGWYIYGGTSCAAPLWAAFTAIVNQERAAGGLSTIGFINPILYNIAKSSSYTSLFHDIQDGSTNFKYPAVTGYDMATGLGTFQGNNLLATLGTLGPAPFAPLNLTGVGLNQTVSLSWTPASGAMTYSIFRATNSAGPFTSVTTQDTSASYSDTGLTNGTTYYYYVTASNFSGTSADSNTVSATPASVAPTAPLNIKAVQIGF
jgi:kumamolisin